MMSKQFLDILNKLKSNGIKVSNKTLENYTLSYSDYAKEKLKKNNIEIKSLVVSFKKQKSKDDIERIIELKKAN